jgi:predicted RNA binding protein YcfA (HicA-like mRNA interferase family)
MTHPTKLGKFSVPMHGGDVKDGTLKSILKQSGLTRDQFRALL